MGLNQSLGGAEPGLLEGWPLFDELQAVAQERLCGPAERLKCRTASGAFADWACRVCEEFIRPEAISPWTWHLIFLYQLKRAGYPFRANDMTLETWLLVGLVRRVLEGLERGKNAQD